LSSKRIDLKGEIGMMKITTVMASTLVLSLIGTGCATKKYVAKTIAPVETRVTGTETKNGDQDKQIAAHGTQIEELDRDLSRTKEKVTDADAKAVAAGDAARQADAKAAQAGVAAENANKNAEGVRTFASNGINQLGHTVDAMNTYQMTKSETVLFDVNQSKLTDAAKAQLDEFAKTASGAERYMIEIQGFTDKTGAASYNESLSERRAQAVARYLAVEHKVPVRMINQLGAGYALPVADDKTRDGRKQNRRVEIRLYVPDAVSVSGSTAKAGGQQ
jgi:outer membrane protein OmpA-like peptidoglycan-associated protein